MNHGDHVRLIEKGIGKPGGVWADFGSGWGAFTLALRDIAGVRVKIYSIDKDSISLDEQRRNFAEKFPDSNIDYILGDFTQSLPLPALDGVIMANSLHFFRDKIPVLKRIKSYLKKTGRLVIVEYDTDRGNIWVPYPVSFKSLSSLAAEAGFGQPQLLHRHPSGFLRSIYAGLLLPRPDTTS